MSQTPAKFSHAGLCELAASQRRKGLDHAAISLEDLVELLEWYRKPFAHGGFVLPPAQPSEIFSA